MMVDFGEIFEEFALCVAEYEDVDFCLEEIKPFLNDDELVEFEAIAEESRKCVERCCCDELEGGAVGKDERYNDWCRKNCVCWWD